MTEILRKLLDIRSGLGAVKRMIEDYGFTDEAPEIVEMQRLERLLSQKVNEWDKP